MIEEGFVKLYRRLIGWEWFQDSHTLHVFIYLLVMAQYKDRNFRGKTIKRGQVMTGRKKISQDTGISEQSVRTALSNLKSTNELTIKSTKRFSIITICNYEKYQEQKTEANQQINQQINQQLTNSQPTTNHIQEYKEGKEGKNNTIGGEGDFFNMKELNALAVKYLGWQPVLTPGKAEALRPLANVLKEDVERGLRVAAENGKQSINYVIAVAQSIKNETALDDYERLFGKGAA